MSRGGPNVDCDSQYTHTPSGITIREVRLREGPVVIIELTVFTRNRMVGVRMAQGVIRWAGGIIVANSLWVSQPLDCRVFLGSGL